MSNFVHAMDFVLYNEGGLTDNVNDAGGITKYGVSLRFLKGADEDVNGDGHVDEKDIRGMELTQAYAVYKKFFWDHYKIKKLGDPDVAAKVMDLFVNMRGRSAARIVQRAVNLSNGLKIKVDGLLGPESYNAINNIVAIDKFIFMENLRRQQAMFYQHIVDNNPSQNVFLHGWRNRASR